jgi:urease accessory protein
LLLAETLVFGRSAMGEHLAVASLDDQWRLRRGSRLVLAEAIRVSGAVASALARPAIGDAARASATVVFVAPHAESLVDGARRRMEDCTVGGVSGWNGLLCGRFLGADAAAVRKAVAALVTWLWQAPLPRVWHI